MTQPCPGYPTDFTPAALGWTWSTRRLNWPPHEGGYCCWACDHDWDDANCTCLEPPEESLWHPRTGWRIPDPDPLGQEG